MLERIYEKLALPESTFLGKRVFKKLFLEHGELTAADRRALSDDVERITWQYSLKPETVPIASYVDDVREYLEIAILEVRLTSPKRAQRLAEIIHRAIPYPLVLVIEHEGAVCLSLAHKRFSKAEHDKLLAEEVYLTSWLTAETPSANEAFLDSLSFQGLPRTHFFALYTALVERLLAMACVEYTGTFRLTPTLTEEERRRQLNQCRLLKKQLIQLQAALRAESQFARKVELHTEIKHIERRLAQATAEL